MGDIVTLAEKAQEKIKQSEQECVEKAFVQRAADSARFCRSDENDAKIRFSFPDCKVYAGGRQPSIIS